MNAYINRRDGEGSALATLSFFFLSLLLLLLPLDEDLFTFFSFLSFFVAAAVLSLAAAGFLITGRIFFIYFNSTWQRTLKSN